MDSAQIIRATAADVDDVIDLFSQALAGLEVVEWLVADPAERAKVLPAVTQIYVKHALDYGIVEMTADRNAVVAYYLDQDAPPPENFEERVRAAAGPHAHRFLAFAETLDAHYPKDVPRHAYIAILGRRPGLDGQGIGDILRHHVRKVIDDANLPSYYEVSSDRLRQSLLRRGSRDIGEPFHMPDGGPIMYPMWRDARVPDPTLSERAGTDA